MTYFEREYMLVDPVTQYFDSLSYTRHECELQFYERRMDVYGFSSQLGLTIAVELKLVRWRQALRQALSYQLCADLVYLGMPQNSIRLVDIPQLSVSGIGLIGIGHDCCDQVLPAQRSSQVREHYRNFI